MKTTIEATIKDIINERKSIKDSLIGTRVTLSDCRKRSYPPGFYQGFIECIIMSKKRIRREKHKGRYLSMMVLEDIEEVICGED